jgi:hypothetical protein
VVTFLFTDVEGSTRRWEADAYGMRAALATHDNALRGAIKAHGGWLFKHTGDGVCAAFSSPKSAVDAAVAAQRALELPVRMGVATGEAELREGDYFGPVLNRVSRLMAAGHGGQILLAESTAGLLSGVDLDDLGQRRLAFASLPRLEPDPLADRVGQSLAGPAEVALDLELQERVVHLEVLAHELQHERRGQVSPGWKPNGLSFGISSSTAGWAR